MRMFHPKTIEYLSKMNRYEDFYLFLVRDIESKGMTVSQFLTKNNLDRSHFYKSKKGLKSPSIVTLDKIVRKI